MKNTNAAIFSPLFLYFPDDFNRLNINFLLKISGSDKQLVGSVASKIKTFRKIEPYKGKGIREKGQYVLKKEGKKK